MLRSRRVIVFGLVSASLAAMAAAPALGNAPSTGGTASGGSGPQASGSQGSGGSGAQTGGAGVAPGPTAPSTPSHPTVPGFRARIITGLAYAPAYAPIQIKRVIWAGNKIRHKPYIYGGGHGAWQASGYDCSGTVSYVLHSAGLLKTSMDSSQFMSWGHGGIGKWITVYTNPGHAFIEVAGIRLDTSSLDDPHPPPGSGPRWRPLARQLSSFEARHPNAL